MLTAEIAKRRQKGQSFRNQSFYDHDFQGQDLTKADFRNATLHGCNFDNCDLSYADFTGADCTGSSFRQAKLYRTNLTNVCLAKTLMDPRDLFGTTITIHCNSVANMKMSPLWVAGWLQFLMAADIPADQKEKIREVAESIIGAERLKAVQRVFTGRDI